MDRLESFGLLRKVDTEAHRVTSVISTGDVARDGAIIDPAGWDFSDYNRNPVVLWMHDDGAMPFARTVDLMATEKELIATAEFDVEDPMGETVFRKIKAGYINATSVRWLPKRTEVRIEGEDKDQREVLVFLEQELLEWSYVTVASDPKALIIRADGAPFAVADYRKPTIDLNMAWLSNLSPTDFQEQAERLYKPMNGHTPAPDFARLERLLVQHFERRSERPDAEEMLVSSLSKITGKSPERIRQEIAK